jgi:hypothetical protein
MRSNPNQRGYWSHIVNIEVAETADGVRVVRVLANGERKPISKPAPDVATAWRWYEPLIGCKTWVMS